MELVVVHGIGQQKTSQTLLEWAEPVLRRLDWLALQRRILRPTAPTGIRRVGVDRLDEVRPLRVPTGADDPDDSALLFERVVTSSPEDNQVRAYAEYEGNDSEPRLLDLTVTEARWADAFLAMGRSEVFDWGLGFAFRAILRLGIYFGRVVTLPPRREWNRANPLRKLFAALLWIVAGPLLAALWMVLVAVALLVVVTLPLAGPLLLIPGLKTWLDPLMRTLVEFIGDAAVWTRRPVRAAAMREVVRDGVQRARARLDAIPDDADTEKLLVVVAHSEGAAISAETLFSRVSGEREVQVDVLVTVGAGVTLLGVSNWLGYIADEDDLDATSLYPRNLVRAWANHHPETAWLNMWGIWDPVPSGPISNGEAARNERWRFANGLRLEASDAIGPREYPVHNTGFAFTDHGAYSSNIAQVIDPVTRIVMGLDRQAGPTFVEEPGLHAQAVVREANHVRSVKAAGLQRAAIVTLALLALAPPLFAGFAAGGRLILSGLVAAFGPLVRPLESLFGFDLSRKLLETLLANDLLMGGGTLIGTVALLSWFSSRLWRSYVERITWQPEGATPRLWAAGLVFRIALAVAAVAGLVVLVWPFAGSHPIPAWAAITLGIALGVYVVLEPLLSPVPRIVEAQR
ncbi:hypothetical protein EYE40_06150 [Glaciihabitans arcticus]|uniref:Uncharacterized protein n=1 Tax=Glaciihabitans arcticus TaxID=2668039 RepID=A0A4Q9GWE9_9MICO|nr:hypothetical protein [Glaciihabitans arcticus]TBN57013.1 hypothetical protein EYE40_06150 [Glaciihabitans arcticus]